MSEVPSGSQGGPAPEPLVKSLEKIKEEGRRKIDSGEYVVITKEETGNTRSLVWKKFGIVVKHDTQEPVGLVMCFSCKAVKIFRKGNSTSSLRNHGNCSPDTKNVVCVPEDAKREMTQALTDWCATDLRAFSVVDSAQFKNVIQVGINIGQKYGEVEAKTVLAHSTTISRNVSERSDSFRQEFVPKLKQLVNMGMVAVTCDGWTEAKTVRHYVCATAHYIDDDWSLQKRTLFVSESDADSQTAEYVKEDLLTNFSALDLSEEEFNKISFVTDNGANLKKALRENDRDHCADHMLNLVLKSSFSVHLLSLDLYGAEAGAIIDKTQASVKFIQKAPKKMRNNALAKNLKAGSAQSRNGQTTFRSFIPMAESALKNFDQMTSFLSKNGQCSMLQGVTKSDLRDIINLIKPIEARATKKQNRHKNTFEGKDLEWMLSFTTDKSGDSPFMLKLKSHVRREIAILEILVVCAKCKDIVGYFKRSGKNVSLPFTLKQDVETRFNSTCSLLSSFLKTEDTVDKVNDTLREKSLNSLVLTDNDRKIIVDVVAILSCFQQESLKLEADNVPTLQLPLLSVKKMLKKCEPKACDSVCVARLKERIHAQIEKKYQFPMRHKIGSFLWPKFRNLNMLSGDESEQVFKSVRQMMDSNVNVVQPPSPSSQESDLLEPPPAKMPRLDDEHDSDSDEWVDKAVSVDEVDLYRLELSSEVNDLKSEHLLKWWKSREERYPKLSKIARKYLAIPATSCSSERVFSTAKELIADRRTSLDPQKVNDILLISSHIKALNKETP